MRVLFRQVSKRYVVNPQRRDLTLIKILQRANSTATACESCSFPPRPSRTSWVTSTVYTSVTYTITSCAATVTNCPLGRLTTETIPVYLTVCPAGTAAPVLPVGPTGSGYPSYSDFKVPSGALPLASATGNLPESTAKNDQSVATNVPPKPNNVNVTCTGSVCYIQASGGSLRSVGIVGSLAMVLGGMVFLL